MVVDKAAANYRLSNKVSKWGGQVISSSVDYVSGTAIVVLTKDGKTYEFRHSSKTGRDALSVLSWSVCRLIDCDIREILPFDKTAQAYLQLDAPTGISPTKNMHIAIKNFTILGLTPESSNYEVMKKYKELAKQFHPDDAPKEAEKEFTEKMAEINAAYSEIKKGRGF